jgi:glycosyltransferase involved in cell wall biosynthesis
VFRGSTRRGLKTLTAAKRAGKKTVWASDDDLLNLDSSNPVGGRYERSKVRTTIEDMMKTADTLWTFSEQMRRKYLEKGFQEVHYCHSIAPFSDSAIQCTDDHHQGSDLIRIGHIGDFSHANEMHNLVSAIQVLSKVKLNRKWIFEFAGFTPPELENHPNVRSVPYIKGIDNFHKWLRSASWSIGIAPLRDTPFNRCKTDNKFRTFSANGIAGIYTKIPPYSDSVVHEHTGLLCDDSSEEYAECLKRLIEDDVLREHIKQQSQKIAMERYHPKAVATQYESILCRLLKLPSLTSTSDQSYLMDNRVVERKTHKIGA